jgi:hypothetical protein
MFITYRRTGGVFAAAALAATMLTVTVAAAILLIVASLTAAAVWAARAVLPRSWRHRTGPPAVPWAHETLEATVVHPTRSSAECHVSDVNSDTRSTRPSRIR